MKLESSEDFDTNINMNSNVIKIFVEQHISTRYIHLEYHRAAHQYKIQTPGISQHHTTTRYKHLEYHRAEHQYKI